MISISKEAVEYNTKQTTKDKSQQEKGTQNGTILAVFSAVWQMFALSMDVSRDSDCIKFPLIIIK